MIVSFFLQAADTVLKVIGVYNVYFLFLCFRLFLYVNAWNFHSL